MKTPKHSPWGRIQDVSKIGETIIFVSTASHGGFFLPQEINEQIPESLRRESGWYEEDCEATIVVCAFPHLFDSQQFESAKYGLKYWYGQSAILALKL